MIQIDETMKTVVPKRIFTHTPDFLVKNEFMDAERIYIGPDQKMYWENWSPRENITFSTKELSVDQAWNMP